MTAAGWAESFVQALHRPRSPPMPRTPYVVALLVVACVGEVAFVGWTPVKALLTTRVSLVPASGAEDRHVTLGVGDSLPVEACIRDGREGGEPRWVDDCARVHPMIFRFVADAPQVARVGERGTIRAVAPGHFKVAVHSMGRTASLEGDVVERISLALSARDTTLRVGDELLVGWNVRREDGGQAPLAELEFASGTLESDVVAPMQTLDWSVSGGARLLARRAGHACYRLTGLNQTTWLSVVVVDSRGMSRDVDGRPVAPDRVESCGQGVSPLGPSGPGERRAPLPPAAVDDARIRPAAIRFFAVETCLDSLGRRLGALPRPGEEGGVVGRCLDAGDGAPGGEGWLAGNFRPRYPEFDLDLERAGDAGNAAAGAGRSVHFADGELTTWESVARGEGERVMGPVTRLQGDETQTVGAVLACAALHRARTGGDAPSLDALLDFARTIWVARAPGEPDVTGCDPRFFPRRAAGGVPGASGWIHESRRFVLRYAVQDGGVRVSLRPLRYGETGVVSLLHDPASGMHRTLENRDATAADPALVPGATPAERWRLRE